LETPRQIFPGVVGDDDERRPTTLVGHCHRMRFIGREKAGRRFIHSGSLIGQRASALIKGFGTGAKVA
jgi:hypothetical protein